MPLRSGGRPHEIPDAIAEQKNQSPAQTRGESFMLNVKPNRVGGQRSNETLEKCEYIKVNGTIRLEKCLLE